MQFFELITTMEKNLQTHLVAIKSQKLTQTLVCRPLTHVVTCPPAGYYLVHNKLITNTLMHVLVT